MLTDRGTSVRYKLMHQANRSMHVIWLWAASLCLAHSHIRLVKAGECDSVDKRGSVKNGDECVPSLQGSDCASGACLGGVYS